MKRNAAWTFLGNTVYMASQWAMLVIMAKTGDTLMVGRFSLALAVAAPVMLLFNLQLRALQATDARGEFRFTDYFLLRLATALLALAVIGGTAAVGGYTRETRMTILLVGVAKAIEAISDVFYGFQQSAERMRWIAVSMMARGALSVAALGAAIYVTRQLLSGIAGVILAWSAVLVLVDIPAFRSLAASRAQAPGTTERKRWCVLVRLSWTALPLGFIIALNSLAWNLPRYFLQRAGGEAAVGVFSALAYIALAGNTVISAIAQSAAPRLARYYAAPGKRDFRRLVLKLLAVGLGLGTASLLAAICGGKPLLVLLYSPEYGLHTGAFVLVMMTAAAQYMGSLLGTVLTAVRIIRPQLPLQVLSVVATGVLSALWIPSGGIAGAAAVILVVAVGLVLGYAGLLLYAVFPLRGSAPGERGVHEFA